MCVCVCWELFLKYAWTFNEVFKITSFPLLPFTCFSWSHLQNAFIDEDVYWIRSFRFLFGRITLISALPFLDKLLKVLLTFNHRLDVREVMAKKVWDFCDWEEKKPYECNLLWIPFSGGSFISFDSHSVHGPIQFLSLSLCLSLYYNSSYNHQSISWKWHGLFWFICLTLVCIKSVSSALSLWSSRFDTLCLQRLCPMSLEHKLPLWASDVGQDLCGYCDINQQYTQ